MRFSSAAAAAARSERGFSGAVGMAGAAVVKVRVRRRVLVRNFMLVVWFGFEKGGSGVALDWRLGLEVDERRERVEEGGFL